MVKFYKLNDTIYTDNKDYNNNKCNCCKTKKNKYVVIGNKKEIKEFGFVCLILLLIMLSYGIYLSLYVLKLIFYDNFIYNILISLHNSMYSWISYFVSLYKTRWIYNTIYTFLFAYLIKKTIVKYMLMRELNMLREKILFDSFTSFNEKKINKEYSKLE